MVYKENVTFNDGYSRFILRITNHILDWGY